MDEHHSSISTQPSLSTEACPNASSPYYLHPGENPGTVLVSPPLDGSNYQSWSKAIKRALLAKNKIKFVNGKLPMPSKDDVNFDSWERCNSMVVSWINRTLSPQIASSVVYIDHAKTLWDDLKERFTKGNYFRFSDLLQEVHSIKQGEKSISDYYTTLKSLWDDLEDLRPIEDCSCTVKCSCGCISKVKKSRDSEYVIYFLKGLNDSFATAKSQILLMEPLPQIGKVYSLVLQQESQLSSVTNDASILYNSSEHSKANGSTGKGGYNHGNSNYAGRNGSGNSYGRGKPTSTKHCTFCDHKNHNVENCFAKNGYPPGYKFKSNSTPAINHVAGSDQVNSSASQADTSSVASQQSPSLVPSQFTPEQMQQLLQLLKPSSQDHRVNQFSSFVGESSTHPSSSSSGQNYFEDDWAC
ncbi:hydroxyjasmonate sulfotransferase [Trifolium repens]|nr:hydroxyjasmonate sulfotransferase [Trifolium repens]